VRPERLLQMRSNLAIAALKVSHLRSSAAAASSSGVALGQFGHLDGALGRNTHHA